MYQTLLRRIALKAKRTLSQAPRMRLEKQTGLFVVSVYAVAAFGVVSILCLYSNVFTPLYAASNPEINYQGKLLSSTSIPVADGTYHMRFRLYTQETGGTALWEDDRSTAVGNRVPVSSGLFSVMLGSSTSLVGIDFNQTLWLEVSIGGTGSSSWETLSPRKRIGSVPSAFVARTADYAQSANIATSATLFAGLATTSFLRRDQSDAFTSGTLTFNAGTSLVVNGAGTFATATATSLYATTLGINSSYFTNLLGAGLINASGALTVDSSVFFSLAAWYATTSAPQLTTLANLATVGTITSGTWNGSAIGPVYGGTGQTSVATGDLLYGSASNVWSRRAIGTTGDVLTVSGGLPVWTATSSLGLGTVGGTGAANRIAFWTNANTLTSSSSFTFSGLTLTTPIVDLTGNPLSTSTLLSFDGAPILMASSTRQNLYLGPGAGGTSTSASSQSNTAIGFNALSQNTIGSQNTAIGFYALLSNTTGHSNTALGYSALFSNTTGYSNTAIGLNALRSNTTGYSNTAIGFYALYYNTTGSFNTAIGFYALFSNTTGLYNTAIGPGALSSNTTGYSNTAIGHSALLSNTTGTDNTAIGREALYSNTTGTGTVAIGFESGRGVSSNSHSFNTFLGFRSARGITTGGENVVLGSNAGYSLTTGQRNIFLGASSSDNFTTGSNNIAIGYNIDLPSNTGSNQLSIGNLIFGRGIDGEGTTVSSGNIGIASSTPQARLAIVGSSTDATSALLVANSANTSLFTVLNNGNVGIGTTTPFARLSVAGSLAVTEAFFDRDASAGTSGMVLQTTGTSTRWVATSTLGLGGGGITGSGASNRVAFWDSASSLTSSSSFTFSGLTLTTPIVDLTGNPLSTSTLLSFDGAPILMASSTRQNLYLGPGAGGTSTSASSQSNTALGYSALRSNTTGSQNTAIGLNALYYNTTGSFNTAIGFYALRFNTTGLYNTAIGPGALFSNTTGSDNIAVGTNATFYNTTGTGTVAIGFESGLGVFSNSHSFNTFLGFRSARGITTGGENVVLGSNAGYSLTTGQRNIFLGASSSDNFTTGFNNIAIGYNIDLPSNTGSNQLSIGNLIFGRGIDGQGTTVSSGNIGIASSTPQARLAIVGSSTDATSALLVANSANTSLFTVLNNGNVGIGTTTPFARLSVAGSLAVTEAFFDRDASAGTSGMVLQTTGTSTRWVATSTLGLGGGGITGSGASNRVAFWDSASSLTSSSSFTFSGLTLTTPIVDLTGNPLSTSTLLSFDGAPILMASSTRQNLYLGPGAGGTSTSASSQFNTAIGFNALSQNTTGSQNTAIGLNALYYNTTGSFNTAIGLSALLFNTTGTGTVAIGFESGLGVFSNSHSFNTFLGFRSARGITTGGENVVLGSNAGYSLTTGQRNIFLGASSSDNFTTGSNNIAIGYNIDLPSNTGSNQLSIGNLIFGRGIDGEGTTVSSGNIGIASSTPQARLAIVGSSTDATSALLVANSANTSLFTVLNNGNVGVGTTTPFARLSVAGSLAVTEAFFDRDASAGTSGMVLQTTGTSTRWVATSTLGLGGGITGSGASNRVAFWDSASSLTSSSSFTFSGLTLTTPIVDLTGNPLSTSTLLSFNGAPILMASSTRQNLYLGPGAGGTSTSASSQFNTAIGFNALSQNTTGGSNTAIGNSALRFNTTGSFNTAIGLDALSSNTTGSENTAIGLDALLSNTTGLSNTALGYSALYSNTTGSENTAIGRDALRSNTTGGSNTAIGNYALFSNTTGSQNTAIGRDALSSNITGSGTVAIGFQSGLGVFSNSHSFNTFLGFRSARGITTGGENVVLGSNAGYSLTTGQRNIFLGASSSDNFTTGSNNIAIGYNIDLPSNTGSNQLSIGNLIFGRGIDGEGTTVSSGNIGIASSTPQARLAIVGSSTDATSALLVANSANTSLFTVLNNGNVGIGTTTPGRTLAIVGDLLASSTGTSTFTGNLQVAGQLKVGTSSTYIYGDGATSTFAGGIQTRALSITGAGAATSTFAQGINLTDGCFAVNGTCISGGGGITGSGASNRVAFWDSASSLTSSSSFTFSGLTLTTPIVDLTGNPLSTSTLLSFDGAPILMASSTRQNLYLGPGAGGTSTSASSQFNTAIGFNALSQNTTGSQNTAIGNSALRFNTTGSFNTAIGLDALLSNTTGSDNTAIGRSALYSNTTGFFNTAIGRGALFSNTTGFQNTAIGTGALTYNTTGSENTAIGNFALFFNTTGLYNTAIGNFALLSNTTGTGTVAIGFESGLGVSSNSHSFNTFLGFRSARGITTGGENVVLGSNAGYSLTTGQRNIFLGASSSDNFTTGFNNIAIGYNIDLPSNTGSNQLSIGNLIFGRGIDGQGTTVSSGNIGIASSTPQARLAIVGSSTDATRALLVANSANTSLFSVDNTGLVTVGDSTGTGDAIFQFASDPNAWSIGYNSSNKAFTIASSTSFASEVVLSIAKGGGLTLNSGILVSNSGQYLCINTTTFEVGRNNSTCSASSIRFKENVEELNYGLEAVMALRPVTFTFKQEMNFGTSTQVGFIAEEVENIIPELVAYDIEGRPSGVNYQNFSALLARGMQELNVNLQTIASTTASSTPTSRSFAESFFANVRTKMREWFASAENGIDALFAKRITVENLEARTIRATESICIDNECFTKNDIRDLLNLVNGGGGSASAPPPASPPPPSPAPEPAPEEPPVEASAPEPSSEESTPEPVP